MERHKLKGADSEITDKLVAAFMTAVLTEEYKPMIIMGLENTNANISSDLIKTKLMQEDYKCKWRQESFIR